MANKINFADDIAALPWNGVADDNDLRLMNECWRFILTQHDQETQRKAFRLLVLNGTGKDDLRSDEAVDREIELYRTDSC